MTDSKTRERKRRIPDKDNEVDLFATNNQQKRETNADSDSSDSEESVYSGLEDEEEDGSSSSSSSGDESSVKSIEEGSGSPDEEEDDDDAGSSSDDDEDTEDDAKQRAGDSDSDGDKSEANSTENDSSADSSSELITKKLDSSGDTSGTTELKESRRKSRKSKKTMLQTAEVHSGAETQRESSTAQKVTVNVPDEYEYDSSDEEDIRNTVGNIPMEWYREFDHIGYDLLGKKIGKPKTNDELEEFLNKMDNPDYWRTVKDRSTGQNVILSDKDAEAIQRMKKGQYADASYDPYEPWVDFFTYKTMIHPVTNQPAHKRSFIPSKLEKLKVGRMVHAIKMGWMKPRVEKKDEDENRFYQLWEKDNQSEFTRRYREHIPAPKMTLPGHDESYNPPPEYLLTEEEELAWNEQETEERRRNFVPRSFSSLRQVPGYSRLINERFERCMDLYLCPRQRKMRMNVNPEDLLPKLPKPKDLQPFPTTQAIVYKGHSNIVHSISVDATGQWLASGSADHTVKLWEVLTGRCMKTLDVGGVVKQVAWNPSPSLCLLAVVVDGQVVIVNPELGDKLVISNTDKLIGSYQSADEVSSSDKMDVNWHPYDGELYEKGLRLKVTHPKTVSKVSWHGRGDYFAIVMPLGDNKSVFIHQLSKRRSQHPFKKSKGLVQDVTFHPTRPFLFVATQRYVRVYNLLKQEMTKKLMTNVKWVSSMAVHPGGDNVIIGSYDSRLTWFDLDLSNKPYQTLRHHKRAIRQVCYHKTYPLFASASDDGTVIVCHGMVYNDLLQNPLLVPVKVLRGHAVTKDVGVLDCQFHPTQPWVFSSGADHTIRLYT